MTVIMYLIAEGYPVLEIDNVAVKEYRQKVFGSETKTDAADARLMARMGFLHQMIGEEFSIQPVHLSNPDEAALKVMARDYVHLQKEITRRQNQLQQVVVVTFPELKAFFKKGTAIPAARALLTRFPSPRELGQATSEEIADVLREVGAHTHAKRADELKTLAVESAGLRLMPHHQWRQGWLLRQLAVLAEARDELLQQITRAVASHPYTPIIESLPVKSPIWTTILIGVIGNVDRFANYGEFRAYAGFFPKKDQSGTTLNSSRLANRGVRLTRRVLGQMVLILLTPSVRNTPFREHYQRLLARGMKPATAQANVAAKLAVVLYGMLKTKRPYDENKHRRAIGLPELSDQTTTTPLDVTDSVAELREDQEIPLEEASMDGEVLP